MTIAKTTIMIITDEIIFLVFLLNFIIPPQYYTIIIRNAF